MTRTFLDAGVLIIAARGAPDSASLALNLIDDGTREFVASQFLRLEVLPKAVYNRQTDEATFYREYFEAVQHWPADLERVVVRAEDLGNRFGLSAMDALHVAAAESAKAEELITTEQPTKPIYRVTTLTVTWLFDPHTAP